MERVDVGSNKSVDSTALCARIKYYIDTHALLFMRSPSILSGQTSLGQLLYRFLVQQEPDKLIMFINPVERQNTFEEVVQNQLGMPWSEIKTFQKAVKTHVYLIVDEAQVILRSNVALTFDLRSSFRTPRPKYHVAVEMCFGVI
jgi:hypothetical protein